MLQQKAKIEIEICALSKNVLAKAMRFNGSLSGYK